MTTKIPNNIILIGPMGAGKSSVAKQLGKLTGKTVYDSDECIELRSGVSISWIFEKEGEVGFRSREAEVILSLLEENNMVLATGAGAVVTPQIRERIVARGFVVFMDITLNEQLYRTRRRREHRPLIKSTHPRESLIQLNNSRRPYYQALADLVIAATHQSAYETAKIILDSW